MNLPDAPIAHEAFFATHFFTVKDQEKSRDFYVRILGGKLIKPENPCYIKLENSWIILNCGGGSIILHGSFASAKGTPGFGLYGATKAALRSFVRTWTSGLMDRHVRSNVFSPGPTDTPIVEGKPADAIARIVSTIPMGRMGEPDEIAKAVLFLASDDSSFVTDIELFVDGGRAQV
jgi:NAD(P)-dependent dehydrogenase (short-subunit alcohol dehydrogenase family)